MGGVLIWDSRTSSLTCILAGTGAINTFEDFVLDLPYCETYTYWQVFYFKGKKNTKFFSMNETINISNLDFKSWAIIIPCGLIALFGLYKILRQSISLIFWVALVIIGALGIGYVLKPDVTRQVVTKIKSGDITNMVPEEQKDTQHEHLNQTDSH